jgi:predicted Fe-S protein YdhL (DUF1289 family)
MAAEIPSPCTSVCAIDAATGWCVGCLRTIDEIAAWGGLDGAAKRALWKRLPARRAELARGQAESAGAPAGDEASP